MFDLLKSMEEDLYCPLPPVFKGKEFKEEEEPKENEYIMELLKKENVLDNTKYGPPKETPFKDRIPPPSSWKVSEVYHKNSFGGFYGESDRMDLDKDRCKIGCRCSKSCIENMKGFIVLLKNLELLKPDYKKELPAYLK